MDLPAWLPSPGRLIFRLVLFGAAWAAGWFVYMVAMVLTVYDGILSLLLQPLAAAFWSGLALCIVALCGLLLRIPPLGRLWRASWLVPASLASAALLILIGGPYLGWTIVVSDPELGTREILEPRLFLLAYHILLFSIAWCPLPHRP